MAESPRVLDWRKLTFYLGPERCDDMQHVLREAEALLPCVEEVQVLSGGVLRAAYRRRVNGQWQAFDPGAGAEVGANG